MLVLAVVSPKRHEAGSGRKILRIDVGEDTDASTVTL